MGRRSEGLEPEAWLFSMKGTNKNKYIIFVFHLYIYLSYNCRYNVPAYKYLAGLLFLCPAPVGIALVIDLMDQSYFFALVKVRSEA